MRNASPSKKAHRFMRFTRTARGSCGWGPLGFAGYSAEAQMDERFNWTKTSTMERTASWKMPMAIFWVCSEGGILRVSKDALNAVAAGAEENVGWQAFRTSDGLRSDECVRGFYPMATEARDGALWFSTLLGAVSIANPTLVGVTPSPPVSLDALKIDGKPVQATGNPSRLSSSAWAAHPRVRVCRPKLFVS